MASPEIKDLEYTYKKPESEVWVLNTDDIPIDLSQIEDQQIVHLAPESAGGNHKHPRTEWFVAIGDLVIFWLDEHGEKHQEHMNPNGQLRLVKVPPFLPHAVKNISKERSGILFEFSDAKMKDVVEVKIV